MNNKGETLDRHFEPFEMHGEYFQLQTRGMIAGKFLADYAVSALPHLHRSGPRPLRLPNPIRRNDQTRFDRSSTTRKRDRNPTPIGP
jgi:aromatic-L-amino-acid/L-tryptophan decarboxylase